MKSEQTEIDESRTTEREITINEKDFDEACVRLIVSESGDITSKILGMLFAIFWICGK